MTRTALIALAAFLCAPLYALAEAYPVKPLRIIVPAAPGSPPDELARTLAIGLVQSTAQQVVVENRPGAETRAISTAPADGYTLFLQDITRFGLTAGAERRLTFEALREFAPVAFAATSPLLLVVHPSIPVTSIAELIALAKERPGELSYGSGGAGAVSELAGELFRRQAGVDVAHVPYEDPTAALSALLQGEVAMVFATPAAVLAHLQSGKLHALAVTTAQRSPLLPAVPALAESLPGFELALYYGIVVPAGTPRERVARLNAELNRILSTAGVHERWARLGAQPVIASPHEVDQRFRDVVARLTRLASENAPRAQ